MRKLQLFLCTLLISASVNGQQILQLSSNQLQFNAINELQLDSQQVSLTNQSNGTIQLKVKFFTLLGDPCFWVNDSIFSLGANASRVLWVYFKPVHNVLNNSELLLVNNGGFGNLSIDVQGQGSYSNSYYSSSQNLSGQALKQALNARLALSYTSLGYNAGRILMFGTIDNWQTNGRELGRTTNKVECVYTGRIIENYPVNTGTLNNAPYSMNTEHTWPQSQGSSVEPMQSDLHHLHPSDGSINSSRGNKPFRWVPSPTLTYTGGSVADPTYFEPRNVHKGAVARAMLYYAVRYFNNGGINLGYLQPQEVALREWAKLYPPDSIAIRRNNAIAANQNNRNPFTDYPQLLNRISNLSSVNSSTPVYQGLFVGDSTVQLGQVNNGVNRSYTVAVVNYGYQSETLTNLRFAQNSMTVVGGNSRVVAAGESVLIVVQYASNAAPMADTLRFESVVPGATAVQVIFRANGNDSIGNFGLLLPVNATAINVGGAGSQSINFRWRSAQATGGSPVNYEVLFDQVGGIFSPALASFPSIGNDTALAVNYIALDQFLLSRGVAVGQNYTLKWTVNAMAVGVQRLASDTLTLLLTRGTVVGSLGNFSLTSPLPFTRLSIAGPVSTPNNFSWQPAATTGDPVSYQWLLDLPAADFSQPVLTLNVANATTFVVNHNSFRNLFLSQQLALGDSVDLKWSVRAISGNFIRLADSAFNIRLVRMPTSADTIANFNLMLPLFGLNFPVQGDPLQQANFRWRSANRAVGVGNLRYDVLVDTLGGDFSQPLVQLAAFTDTAVIISYGDLADQLLARGVLPGQTFAAQWKVIAKDGPLQRSSGETRPINFSLGVISSLDGLEIGNSRVYPNPIRSGEQLRIEHTRDVQAVQLYNLQGQRMAAHCQFTAHGALLNTEGIAAGVYLVIWSDGSRQYQKKIVINP
jgi:endonuclease I